MIVLHFPNTSRIVVFHYFFLKIYFREIREKKIVHGGAEGQKERERQS